MMKCRSWICPFILLLIFSTPVLLAQPQQRDYEQLFDRAARSYEAGQIDEAITTYNLLLQQGFESGPLYYNLGNCFLKKAELGKAILNYERAKRLIPMDSDLGSNYTYAKTFIRSKLSEPSKPWVKGFLDRLFDRASMDVLTVDVLTALLSLIYLLSISILISGLFVPAIKRFSKVALFLLALLFIVCGFGLNQKISLLDREAIIIAQKAEGKFQPFDRAPVHFTLEEGSKVQVLRISRDWVKVVSPDKRKGWLRTSCLELI